MCPVHALSDGPEGWSRTILRATLEDPPHPRDLQIMDGGQDGGGLQVGNRARRTEIEPRTTNF
jgi:hypothetical protein